MKLLKLIICINILFFLYNCSEKTIYTGKIINENEFNYLHIESKNQLIAELGEADYIDPIESKYYYYSEKRKIKSLFNQKITNRVMLVFKFNKDDIIINVENYNLKDEAKLNFSNDKSINNIIKRGLIERWFGGVGKSQSGLPTSSQVPSASQ